MYDTLMEEVRSLLTKHHQNLGTNTHDTDIAVTAVTQKIREAGGTDVEGLRQFSWEDLQKCGAPLALAKRMAQIFRAKTEMTGERSVLRPKDVARMAIKDLIDAYDPRDPRSAVNAELEKLSRGKPCVVFGQNGTVLSAATLACLTDVMKDDEARTIFLVNGHPHPVYKIGERPAEMADENPLYPGRALRSDGTCTQTQRSWEGVTQAVRAILYLAQKGGEVRISALDDAHDFLDLAISSDAEKKLRARYPVASIAYDAALAEGFPPRLKVARGGPQGSVAGNANPFPANKVR